MIIEHRTFVPRIGVGKSIFTELSWSFHDYVVHG